MAVVLTTEQLLEVSPDKLLETHTVAEAEAVSKQLSREVEKKREELRVMVGERYRELIEAADTIQNMRLCSGQVIQSVSGMQYTCQSLRQQAAIKPNSIQVREGPALSNGPFLALAAGIQLLTAVPEQIWAAVDAGHLVRGAGLYLLGQHVHSWLNAGGGGQLPQDKVSHWFPVIGRQWATLQQLHPTLITTCKEKLSCSLIDKSTAVDSLAATFLLRNCTLEQLYQELLTIRSASLKGVLQTGRTESARPAICATVKCIISTVQAVHEAFIRDGLKTMLTDLKQAAELINLQSLGPIAKHLPDTVLQYRPKLRVTMKTDVKNIISGLEMWLDDMGGEVRDEAKGLLTYVATVEGLVGVREGLYIVLGENREVWEKTSNEAFGKKLCLWDVLYKQILTDQVVELLANTVTSVIRQAQEDVKKMLDTAEENSEAFVWTDTSTDLGCKWGKGQSEKGGLEMKSWGWNFLIQEVCSNMDIGLKGVLDSMMAYTNGEEVEGPFRKFADSGRICDSVSNICRQQVVGMVAGLRSLDKGGQMLARLWQALIPLAPSLAVCVSGSNVEESSTGLSEVNLLLEKEITIMFNNWISSKIVAFSSDICLLNANNVLLSLPAWDKESISEIGDSGEEVTSIICVPPSPSLPLITSLLHLASDLHKAHPASFPAAILQPTNTKVVQTILEHYELLASNTLTQNFALQLLFDIHFIQTILISRDNKEFFSSQISSIISSLEANIDPFDLSVFSPHLQLRVKKAAGRVASGLGSLVPADRLAMLNTSRVTSTSGQDTHNTLCMEQPCPRFQLLPIAPGPLKSRPTPKLQLPHISSQVGVGMNKKSTDGRDKSPAQHAAASFFGSMPWFSGNNS